MGFKFTKKFNSKYFTGTVIQINEGNINDITRKVVYNDGDEENISLLQIRKLKKSSTNIDNITFNESIECGDVEFNFRNKFKNHGFFISSVSDILPRKGKNRRVLYCDGEEEDLSLKSIQTLLRLYPLPPPYLIREDPRFLLKNTCYE